MDNKTIIIGSRGQLGSALMEAFADHNPLGWDRGEVDVTNQADLEAKIFAARPTIIINAAGYTNVDEAETHSQEAQAVNADAVGFLARAARQLNALIVHYSTDYVFDGSQKNGYTEHAVPDNPVNVYGKTKLLGEQQLRQSGADYYLIRLSLLFGPGGRNFVKSILEKAKGLAELKVADYQSAKPTYSLDLAKRTREIVEKKIPFGVYHVTNEAPTQGITRYVFAKKAVELAGLSTSVVPCSVNEFPQPARRPAYSALQNTKLPPLRDWQDALQDYITNL